jgi:ubiquinone/menaquinone biosynthesis C-methylase UbiE
MGMQRFLAAQLRKPQGWFGSLVMSRVLDRVNGKIVGATLALLDVKPEHDVLEIGFGGGSALRWLAKRASSGVITGVDISPDMVQRAERQFQSEIQSGRVRVQLGDIAHLPFGDSAFDRVFTVNTIYFWPDTKQGLAEIYRVLRPGGIAAISIRTRDKMEKRSVTKHNFSLFSADEVADLMRSTGFRNLSIDHRDQDKAWDQAIILGSR